MIRRRTASRRAGLSLLLAAALLMTGACGDDDEETKESSAGSAATTTSKDLDKKPEIEIPDRDPPTALVTEDIVVGTGAEATTGSNVTMQYVGQSWSTKEQFDASWDRSGAFGPFPLGAGKVIKGWDEGIVGMKEGGRRILTIPPDLAYGAAGRLPVIAENETLVFVVDLTKVG